MKKKNYKTLGLLSYSIGIVLWFGADFYFPGSQLIGIFLLLFSVPYFVFSVFDWKLSSFSILLRIGSFLHIAGTLLLLGTIVWSGVAHPGYSALGPGVLGELLIFVGLTCMVGTMIAKK